MKNILKKLGLLLAPVALYLCVFVAFEPNNYFNLKATTPTEAPIARLQEYKRAGSDCIIVGDSRFAHFDMQQVQQANGKRWSNLAFGGASLRETVDVLEWAMQQNPNVSEVVFGISFYTMNQSYDTDRMSSLETTLRNPLAYMLNLEYNVNMLTNLSEQLRNTATDTVALTEETGDWVYPADYTAADGTLYPLHTRLATYPATILPRCQSWQLNEAGLQEFYRVAALCRAQGIRLTVVLPPMADNVMDEICLPLGIADTMQSSVLPTLTAECAKLGVQVLDYEWQNRPSFDDDTQFFDGFHLDTRYGLPQWTQQLFDDLKGM